MNKQKKGFVLAEATLAEINKQLKINLFTIVVLLGRDSARDRGD